MPNVLITAPMTITVPESVYANKWAYKTFKSQWRKRYNRVSRNIRELRDMRHEIEHAPITTDSTPRHTRLSVITLSLAAATTEARAMMDLIAEAKVKRREQWELTDASEGSGENWKPFVAKQGGAVRIPLQPTETI